MSQKGIINIPIIIVLIVAALAGYFLYSKASDTGELINLYQNHETAVKAPISSSSGETTGEKTYRDTKYNFSFEYPGTWSVKDSCFNQSSCLEVRIRDPRSLPSAKDYKGTMAGRVTKEAYLEDKSYLDKGSLPLSYPPNSKIVKLNGINAMEYIGYSDGFESDGAYHYAFSVSSEILSDKVEITLTAILPIKGVTRKDSYDETGLNANLKKADDVSKEILNKGKFETPEIENVAKPYQNILSTFKFN